MKLRVLVMLLVLGCASSTAQAQPKPDQPASAGWIAKPAFTAPTMYQNFTFTPALVVNLQAKIPKVDTGYTVPGPFDFVAYAKASPFTEKWHVQVVKLGPGGEQVPLQSFEGVINGDQFSVSLNADWFKAKGGPGKYGALAHLSQLGPQGMVTGLGTGVGFGIVAPVSISEQAPGVATQKVVPAAAAIPLPKLAVIGAQTKVDSACKKMTELLTVAVSVSNSGGPIPANKGTVYVKETGGANFSSLGIHLPEIKTNETRVVEVPAGVLPQFRSALPGSHILRAHLNPVMEGGKLSFDKPAGLYQFTVNLPGGLCLQKVGPPPPVAAPGMTPVPPYSGPNVPVQVPLQGQQTSPAPGPRQLGPSGR